MTPLPLLVPRARQSPIFNRLLLAATGVISFLGAWLGIAQLGTLGPSVTVSGIPVLPIFIGAAAAAIVLNAILWVVDRFEHPLDEIEVEDESAWEQTEEGGPPETSAPPIIDMQPPDEVAIKPNPNGKAE